MKKSLLVALVASQFLIHGSFASLGVELEGTLAACKYGENRSSLPFSDLKSGETRSAESALSNKWNKYPSDEINFNSFKDAPDRYQYRSALCEEALQRAIRKKLGSSTASDVLKNRCSALNQDSGYRDELSGSANSWVQAHSEGTSRTDSEGYWCDGDKSDSTELIQVACAALKANRDLRNEDSKSYQAALKNLKKNCSSRSAPSRALASRDDHDLGDDDSEDDDGEPVYQGRRVPGALPGDMNVPVIQRIVSVPYMPPRPGCGGGAARALVINPPGGALYTLANAAVAGLGAVLSYKGARHADDLRHSVAQSTIDAYKAVGAVPDLYAGRMFWGQGGVYPTGGGPIRGGVCGSPPFNTAFTGCMGGMPGQLPVGGGNCPGPSCGGMYGNGFFPGGGCGGMGGGLGGGMPGMGGMGGGMMPRPGGCGTPWGMGANPYGTNPYMNNPAMMGRPGGFMGPVNPMMLDQERQRLQDLQNQIARQRAQMNQLNGLNNQLLSLDQNRNQLLNRLQGYNGLLSNLNGPGGFNGNPGVFNPSAGGMGGGLGGGMPGGMGMGPGMGGGIPGGMGPGMGSGMGGGIMGGGCPTMACYPGNPGAYYSPPMIVGNSGYGGSDFGFPNRNNFSFGINYTNSGL